MCVRRVPASPKPTGALLLFLLTVGAGAARAQSVPTPPAADAQRPPTWTSTSGVTFTLFPTGDPFPVYVADPNRPTNAIVTRFFTHQAIPAVRTPRVWLSAGGRFGMFRIGNTSPGRREWQVSIEAGLDAMFDSQNKMDSIGWDGNYGLTLTTASARPWMLKIALLHVSAHLGDEYVERTHQSRINYTREEIAIGVASRLGQRARVYGEVGNAYVRRGESQEQWRAQGGLEYESKPRLFGRRFAWYAATDVAAWEERDWRLDETVQGGIVTRSNNHTYRLLIEYTEGRPPLGEFFKYSEASINAGFRIDF